MRKRAGAGALDGRHRVELLEPRRLLAGVALDLNYGNDGLIVEDLAIDGDGDTNDSASAAALQGDGKLVIVGGGAIARNSSQRDLILLRLNPDGTRDAAFGTDGVARFRQLATSFGTSVIALPDGRLLVGGTAREGSTQRPLVLRYFSNGRLDSSFGNGGVGTAPPGSLSNLALLSDGKILAAGQTGGGLAALWRFDANGNPDESFGIGGIVSFDLQTSNQFVDEIVLLEDGRFLGRTSRGVARFGSDGSQDLTFAQGGFLGDGTVSRYARQDDGRYLTVSTIGASSTANWKVSRYLENGEVDSSFAVDGVRIIDLGVERSTGALIVEPDGQILLGGTTQVEPIGDCYLIARLMPDGAFDPTFAAGGILAEPMTGSFGSSSHELRRVLISPANELYAVGTTGRGADHIGFSTGTNIAALRYRLDVPLEVNGGGPYGPVNEGSSFSVSAAGSSYPNGTITSYEWSAPYRHGQWVTAATGVNGTVTAPDSPSMAVGLRVTTSDGLRALTTVAVPVNNVAPVIEAPAQRRVAVGTTINIAGRIIDPGQDTFSLNINFGDGTSPVAVATPTRAFSFDHVYAKRGTYPVVLSVGDSDGDSTVFTCDVHVVHVAGRVYQDKDDNGAFAAATDDGFAGQTVFVDLDGNGALDPGEPQAISDAGGDFGFDGLSPGTYQVRIIAPAGWRRTSPATGFFEVTVSDSVGARCDFAFTQRARITGMAFNDLNANGVRDPGENPSSVTQIFLDLNNNGMRENDEPVSWTIGTGEYLFTNLAPGTFVVRPVPSFSKAQTAPPVGQPYVVSVEPAEVAVVSDFGFCASARVTGVVFGDVNRNGVRDPGEQVYILAPFADLNDNGVPDPGEPQGVFQSGFYALTGLPPGTYHVRLHFPGIAQSFPAKNEPHVVTVSLGQTVSERDFGFFIDDLVPPAVTQTSFLTDTFRHQLRVVFSEPVTVSPPESSLRLTNLTTGQIIQSASIFMQFNAATRTATFSFPGLEMGALPDGNYQAELLAAGIVDVAANPLASDFEFSFFVLAGDANRDRTVNLADFNILAANFGQSNRTFSQGDFNYDGRVNLQDFNILASRFGTSLGPDGQLLATSDHLPGWPGAPSSGQRRVGIGGGSAAPETESDDELLTLR